ncbi:uncharacterized protein LOC142331029 isoform X2 [Lycorma delicatula]|uniref:uncharacterized protein LOC142331029 isoform X2 n=1 Tax=Lycorma delicatula TaxID=130591 RepID=UPI003F516B69
MCLVDSGAIGKVEDRKVTCTITNPSRSLTENHITSLADGTYRIGCYTPFEEVLLSPRFPFVKDSISKQMQLLFVIHVTAYLPLLM